MTQPLVVSLLFLVTVFHGVPFAASQNLVSNALGSHMVLQRAPQRANIWGWTTAGATVTVLFNGQLHLATASSTGSWNVLLPATPAGGPYTIKVTSSSGNSTILEDVLFGDVYVCSGQSNMQFTVKQAFNATAEIEAANDYPNIRVFTVGEGTFSATPLEEFKTIAQHWSVASAATVGVGDWSEFSAACWFFGRDLYDKIKVPLGLFSTNWGGTIIEAWSSPDALAKCPVADADAVLEGPAGRVFGPNDRSQLWNAMIVPILPMSIIGANWYQGESNANNPNHYACTFPAMITDWRAKWGGDTPADFGFYFVQLAPWINGDLSNEPLIRLAQIYATKLPNVGVATAMDWGDPSSPFHSVHTRYKQVVGYRLYLNALAISYKQPVQHKGPEAASWSIVPNSSTVQIAFTTDSIGSGLVFQQKSCDASVPINQCGWFELNINGVWTNSTAQISGSVLLITPPTIGKVVGARYAFANYPVATLYNREGLPALPFYFPNPIVPK